MCPRPDPPQKRWKPFKPANTEVYVDSVRYEMTEFIDLIIETGTYKDLAAKLNTTIYKLKKAIAMYLPEVAKNKRKYPLRTKLLLLDDRMYCKKCNSIKSRSAFPLGNGPENLNHMCRQCTTERVMESSIKRGKTRESMYEIAGGVFPKHEGSKIGKYDGPIEKRSHYAYYDGVNSWYWSTNK